MRVAAATTTSKGVTQFFLPIDPMPAPRPRCVSRGGFASSYNPKEYTVWKEQAALLISDAVGPMEPVAGDLVVTLTVQRLRPKTSKLTRPAPDVDNFGKAVLDAITDSGRIWLDDKQVATLIVTKQWGPEPGVHVTITEAQ